jgi:leucyl aminopeptidase (aminopeptidase T)
MSASSKLSDLYFKVAKKVVDESLQLKQGETVTIETWNNGLPFARQVVMEARKKGAIPLMIFEDEKAYLDGIKNMPKETLGKMGKHELNLLSGSEAYIFIPGPPVGAYAPMLTREESSNSTGYNASWYDAAEKAKLRGVRLTFGYIGRDLAKLLGKKEEDIVRIQLKSVLLLNTPEIKQKGEAIAQTLQDGIAVSLGSGSGEKLEFTLKGDLVVEDGVIDERDIAEGNNMGYLPPGMVQKSVDGSSATGSVRVSPSLTRLGLTSEATLHFESGKLVRWEAGSKASKNKLDELIGVIPEANRTLKMITVGFNPSMKYGYGQDRFVAGAVGLVGIGFTAMVRRGDLTVNGKSIISKGSLSA